MDRIPACTARHIEGVVCHENTAIWIHLDPIGCWNRLWNEITGYGVVERTRPRANSVWSAKPWELSAQQNKIHRRASEQVFRELSAEMSVGSLMLSPIEEVFYSVMPIGAQAGQVRGVALLAALAKVCPWLIRHLLKSSPAWLATASQKGAGSVHGGPSSQSGRIAPTCRCGRRPGHRHLPIHTAQTLGLSEPSPKRQCGCAAR